MNILKEVGATILALVLWSNIHNAWALDHGSDVPAPEVQQQAIAVSDTEINARLSNLLDQFPELRDLSHTADSGVVVLRGTIVDSDAKRLAIQLAEQIAGVVAVRDETKIATGVRSRFSPLWEKTLALSNTALSYIPLLVVAAVVIILFGWLGLYLSRREKLYAQFSDSDFLRNTIAKSTRVLVTGLGILVALELLDATALVGAIIGTAGVIGLALGFAFRDTMENYIAGILLSVKQPFLPNDHVMVEGREGKVIKLTSRATILLDFEGNHVRIPNSTVFQSILTNYTRNPKRRFEFGVGVSTEISLIEARKLALKTLEEMTGVLADPGPAVVIDSLGDSNVALKIYGWVDQREADYTKVRSEAIRLLKTAFDKENYEMPEPIYRLKISQSVVQDAIGDSGSPRHDEVALQAGVEDQPPGLQPELETIQQDISPDQSIDQQIAQQHAVSEDRADDKLVDSPVALE